MRELLSRHTPRTRFALAAALFTFALAVNVVQANGDSQVAGDGRPASFADYRDATYYPTLDFLQGNNPYDVEEYLDRQPVDQEFDLYAPFWLVLNLPLALIPYRISEFVYFSISAGLTLVLAGMLLKLARRHATGASVLVVASLIALSTPGRATLAQGQVTILIVLGAVLALRTGDGRSVLAGFGLALCWIKPQFGVPLTILLLARRSWRTVATGTALVAVGCLLVLLPLVARSGGAGAFVGTIQGNVEFANNAPYSALGSPQTFRLDAASLLTRVAPDANGPLVQLLTFVVVMSLGVGAMAVARRRKLPLGPEVVTGLICAVTLMSVFHARYDLLLFLVPLTGLVANFDSSWRRHAPRLRWALVVVLLFMATYSTTALNRLLPSDADVAELPLAIANAAVLGVYVLLAVRRQAGEDAHMGALGPGGRQPPEVEVGSSDVPAPTRTRRPRSREA